MSQKIEEHILGAFYGQALGDAFGMPSELWPRCRVKEHFDWIDEFLDGPQENAAAKYFKAAQITDDTSMAIALADSITECNGRVDTEVIGGRILDWVESFDAFSKNILGPTSKVALAAIKSGQSISDIPNLGVTNGAAMRVMPLGCLLPTECFDDFYGEVAAASAPTHKSDVSVAGAMVIAWAISMSIDGHPWSKTKSVLPEIALRAQQKDVNTFSPSLAARIELALSVTDKKSDDVATSANIYDLIGTGTSAIESVPAAIAMVDLAQPDPGRCAELCANLGGDTDTIGAMATAICGAISGIGRFDATTLQRLKTANDFDFETYAKNFLAYRAARQVR
jgi:ADP-ribosylglycohydrolase